MGTKHEIKLLKLTALFIFTCLVVYRWDTSAGIIEKQPLADTFRHIEGYTMLRDIELTDDAFEMLNLDDYLFADYSGPSGPVNLYIGYYFSTDKAYASHSPTICYPSQGWKIDSSPKSQKLKIGSHTINYNEIITSFREQKELVIYWYQARLYSNTHAYKNKIDMGYNKLAFRDDHHGFVRVAVPFSSKHHFTDAQKTAMDFISSFYPLFKKYLTNS